MSASPEHDEPMHTLETLRPLLIKLTLSCAIPHPKIDNNYFSAPIPTPAIRATGPPLDLSELHTLFSHLADPKFTSNTAHHAQIGACLTSLRMSGWDMSSEALTIASEIFLEKALPVKVPKLASHVLNGSVADLGDYEGSLDIVGTGGDGHDTFNVSTTAAIVVAGVPGVRVCKHGARASSSTSGSADLLAALDITLSNLTPSTLPHILPTSPFTFLFAQLYHPTLAPLALIRRSLGFPTIFNVLGPLINPSRPKRCVMGVHSWGLGQTFAEALREGKCDRAWVVCGREGLDEISIEGQTDVWELRDGDIKHLVISPKSFGLRSHPLEHVKSGTSHDNAAVARYLFSSNAYQHEDGIPTGPLRAPLSFIDSDKTYTIPAGKATTLEDAVSLARKSLCQGGAHDALDTLRREANRAGAMLEQQQKEREERELRRINQRDDFYYSKDLRRINTGTDLDSDIEVAKR